MTTKSLVDLTLGLDNQARAVLQALSLFDAPEVFQQVETAAWYNGRETGFVLSFSKDFRKGLHIVVAECRNSDDIVLQSWIGEMSLNPPTIHDWPESAYETQLYFPYLRIDQVVGHIHQVVNEYSEL